LIELLVVIAIIALLMAILMPALQRVRKQARAVACLSNLRHWGLIFKMYTDDNNGKFYGAWSTNQQGHVWIGALKPYYQDEDINFCPSAIKIRTGGFGGASGSCGGVFEAYGGFTENDPRYGYAGLAGSYGINDWVGDPAQARIPSGVHDAHSHWVKPDVKGAYRISLFLDAMWLGGWPKHTDEPPLFENITGFTNSMNRYCLNRHEGHINGVFLDFSVRKIGLKELWTLKWNKSYNVNGLWTTAGGCRPSDWPEWMRGFKDY